MAGFQSSTFQPGRKGEKEAESERMVRRGKRIPKSANLTDAATQGKGRGEGELFQFSAWSRPPRRGKEEEQHTTGVPGLLSTDAKEKKEGKNVRSAHRELLGGSVEEKRSVCYYW